MSSEFIAFATPGGWSVMPAGAIIYLDGEACTARAMLPGERGRTIIGGIVVDVVKLEIDTLPTALGCAT